MDGQTLPEMTFDGETFNYKRDLNRLTAQFKRVRDLMLDGKWRTLHEIQAATGDPFQSISARLRDLRKERFGSYTVERRYVNSGTFEYRVVS